MTFLLNLSFLLYLLKGFQSLPTGHVKDVRMQDVSVYFIVPLDILVLQVRYLTSFK